MARTDVLVIGAGPAGLAVSHELATRGIDHVVLERGRVAESWLSQRWDSLRLITPNWLTRLPGMLGPGADPGGFMPARELAFRLAAYGAANGAPVREGVAVQLVSAVDGGYQVKTPQGNWLARAVVIATGACGSPKIHAFSHALPRWVQQVWASCYRNPEQLAEGGVLVVGASASGVQIAREVHHSGRPVTLAVGAHSRMLRHYRGRDIFAWLDDAGVLDDGWTKVTDLAAARAQPSLQLAHDGALDLAGLEADGVTLLGRLLVVDEGRLRFGGNLAADSALSETRLRRVLDRIDAHITAQGIAAPTEPVARRPRRHGLGRADELVLDRTAIRTVVWATGFRRDYSWLEVPVLDQSGEIQHAGGLTAAPGLFVIGLPFLRRRSSTFVAGIGRDAQHLAAAIATHLDHCPQTA